MPKRISNTEEIYLPAWEDDKGNLKPITIGPLVIKKFRKLATILEEARNPAEGQKEEPFLDVMLRAVAFAMETFEPELSDPDTLSDYIDVATLEYILDVAAGVKFDDPNLKAAMATSGMS